VADIHGLVEFAALGKFSCFEILKHWAMVISTVFYGWGARDTVAHVTSFLGITISRKTHGNFFKHLTLNHVKAFWRLLSRCSAGLMVWDNFQRGQEIRDQ
jgi:hypothetical protein